MVDATSADEQGPTSTRIVRERISKADVEELAEAQFGDMVKAVVDVERRILAIAGELHSDQEAALIDDGSWQENLWGINLYPERPAEDWIEFDSMINLRPSRGNRSRWVEDEAIREAIRLVVDELVGG